MGLYFLILQSFPASSGFIQVKCVCNDPVWRLRKSCSVLQVAAVEWRKTLGQMQIKRGTKCHGSLTEEQWSLYDVRTVKIKYLKKGVACCTLHITPMSSLSYKCLTVEHVPSDFRHLEERFTVCWRHALWGIIFPRAAPKSEPELPIGGNQQISVWENG